MSSNGLAYTFTANIRAGVCVLTTIGALSAFTTFLLLLHLIHVAFIPTTSRLRYLLSKARTTVEPETTVHSSAPGDRNLDTDNPSNTPTPANPRQGQGHRNRNRQTVSLHDDRLGRFLPMQLRLFISFLLLSDCLQALGVLVQLRWLQLGGVQVGTACSVQAALITFGDVASAVWTVVIAVHTFATVCFGKQMSTPVVFIITICGWTIPVLTNLIGVVMIQNKPIRGPFYGVAGAWCLITGAYDVERASLLYLPMLLAALIITLMYIPVFLTIRGNLLITRSPSDWCGYRFIFRSAPPSTSTDSTPSGNSSSRSTHLRRIARKMLWYPIVYMALILPTVVCRFKAIYGSPVSLPVLLGCVSLISSMGLSNVCIYVFTRNLGGTPWFARPLLSRQTDVEVFVERTTVNETGSASRGDDARLQDSASHISSLSAQMKNPRHHSDISLGGDLYPESEANAKDVELGRLPPTTKHVVLQGLTLQHSISPSLDSPNSGLVGIRVERVGVRCHDDHSQRAFHDTLQSNHNVTTHGDPSK